MLEFLFFLSSGLFLGWSLGGNDAANVFGTAVGSKMMRFKTAAIIGSVFVILGSVISGAGVSDTLDALGSVNALGGAFIVTLSAALCVAFMSKTGIPVSTSQAIVGAIIGWNFYAHKPTDVSLLSKIFSTWVVCPLIAGVVAAILFLIIKQILRTSKMHLLRQDMYTRIGLVIVGAFGAYSLGANNIANVMGVFVKSSPIEGVFGLSDVQTLFLIGAIMIAIGIITYSKKVIETVGNSLMEMSPIVALVVVFAQALVLFIFSSKGLQNLFIDIGLPPIPLVPVSSSQAIVGAIIGIGLAKGSNSIKWSLLGKISIGWVLTPLLAAIISFIGLFMLANIFKVAVIL